LRVRASANDKWRTLLRASQEDAVDLIDFSKDGRSALLLSSLGSDTTRVVERNLASRQERELAKNQGVDAEETFVHPTRHVVQAVAFARGRKQWTVVDPQVRADFDAIGKLTEGDVDD